MQTNYPMRSEIPWAGFQCPHLVHLRPWRPCLRARRSGQAHVKMDDVSVRIWNMYEYVDIINIYLVDFLY